MGYTYTPAYYSSFQDTLTSICKNILPFSFKGSSSTRRLASQSYEQTLAKQQTENLKWQQDMFHKMLNMIALHKEGMLSESKVSAFRIHLLDMLISSPANQEAPQIIRDKLLFLQELFYAKCVSEEDYHSSKRPLLMRLAVQGEEINSRDVMIPSAQQLNFDDESEWSVVELRDDVVTTNKDNPKNKTTKHRSPIKQFKGAMSKITSSLSSNSKQEKNRGKKTGPIFSDVHSAFLMPECSPPRPSLLYHESKQGKKSSWGLKTWRKRSPEGYSATPCLWHGERSDDALPSSNVLGSKPVEECANAKLIQKIVHPESSTSDFFMDKDLGGNIKKELSRIQSELSYKNPNLEFSNEQMEAISTRLPVDKSDLKKFFPESWCDNYGDNVLEVVKKEFKDHVSEMENLRTTAKEKQTSSQTWIAFEENDENCSPNMKYSYVDNHSSYKDHTPVTTTTSSAGYMSCPQQGFQNGVKEWHTNNPFFDEEDAVGNHKFDEEPSSFYQKSNSISSISLFA